VQGFRAAGTPQLIFEAGAVTRLPGWLAGRDIRCIGLIVGRSTVADGEVWNGLLSALGSVGVKTEAYYWNSGESVAKNSGNGDAVLEPSPLIVDRLAEELSQVEAIVAVGGGSAIDTGKAVAAAICMDESVEAFLEGVGTRSPSGRRLPLIVLPTTAGTGSEATKNAVLSRPGPDGYKKSLRHDGYVPDLVILDPQLHLSCPRGVTAASGLDAITQLIEAYGSTQANPFTDALALAGLEAAGRSFLRAVERGESDLDARSGMALAAYLSGVCLANAGLGTVHGLASPAGALAPVPHGVFCGRLLSPVLRETVGRLRRTRDGLGALGRYAAASRALTGRSGGSLEDQLDRLLARIDEFCRVGGLQPLRSYGITEEIAAEIGRRGGNKNNPYKFDESELVQLVLAAC
jgi:alcohol dehydrogenase class IV